ncbi:MAG: ABC transporter permease [Actinobacteria bacterium]|nr:ABC transporter permease [Actinomycetota bacterium]
MSGTRILAIAQRIIRQFGHDKRTLTLLFFVPIVVISLLGPLLTTKTTFKIGLVDEDKPFAPPASAAAKPAVPPPVIPGMSPPALGNKAPGERPKPKPVKVSDRAIDALKADGDLTVTVVREKEIPSLLRDGQSVAVLKFPANFSKELLSGGSPKATIVVDGSNPSRAQGAIAKVQKALASQGKSDSKLSIDVGYRYGGDNFDALDYFAPAFIAFFAFFFVFLLTSVSFLRERGQGTIERLMSSPASRLEIILGYQLGFIVFATIQVAIIMLYTVYALKVHYIGNIGAVFLVEFLLTLVGVNMGIFFSSFAANELQVIQFIPIVIIPQALLSGIVMSVEEMPKYFRWLAEVMPLTHANNALKGIMIKGYSLGEVSFEIAFLIGFALLMVVLSAATIRRRIA